MAVSWNIGDGIDFPIYIYSYGGCRGDSKGTGFSFKNKRNQELPLNRMTYTRTVDRIYL